MIIIFFGFSEKGEMPENGVIMGEDQCEKERGQAEISSAISGPIPTRLNLNLLVIMIMMIDLLHLEVKQMKVIIVGALLLIVVGSQILDIWEQLEIFWEL